MYSSWSDTQKWLTGCLWALSVFKNQAKVVLGPRVHLTWRRIDLKTTQRKSALKFSDSCLEIQYNWDIILTLDLILKIILENLTGVLEPKQFHFSFSEGHTRWEKKKEKEATERRDRKLTWCNPKQESPRSCCHENYLPFLSSCSVPLSWNFSFNTPMSWGWL